MTVNTTTSRISANGDGVSTAFAVPFYFLESDDLLVYVGGVPQTLTTNYTVSGAGNPAGGSITFAAAPPAGSGNVVIVRDPDPLQNTKYPANDPFPAKSHETALDKLTMLVQRTRDLIGRALTLSDADASTASLTVPTPQAGYLLGWNGSGNALANYAGTGGGGLLPLPVTVANGGTGATTAATARANLGLTLGTAAGNVPVLDAGGKVAPSVVSRAVTARSSNTMLTAADFDSTFLATGTFTQTTDTAANLGAGWRCFYRNDGSGIVTFAPGSGTVDGVASIRICPGEGCWIVCDGTNLKSIGRATGLVLINRQVVSSAVSTMDFSGFIFPEFAKYLFKFYGVQPVTNGTGLCMRVSQAGVFKTGATDYDQQGVISAAGSGLSAQSSSGAAFLFLTGNLPNTGTRPCDGDVEWCNLQNTTLLKQCTYKTTYVDTTPTFSFITGKGEYTGATTGGGTAAIDGVRFLFGSGNIAAGTFELYGYR